MSVRSSAHEVLAARRGRVVFAMTLLIAGLAALATIASFGWHPLPPIAGAWALALGFGALARLAPAAIARASGGPRAPVAPFASRPLDASARDDAAGLRLPSMALPLVAVSFVLPLTLHALVAAAFGGAERFEGWIALSAILVSHAHVVLAVLAARFARAFIEQRNKHSPVGEGVLAVVWTTLAAAVPGVVLIGIPPALTFATGMLFVPVAFHFAAQRLAREEAALEAR